MSGPVTQSNEIAPGIVAACTWTGDATFYVTFTITCGGVLLWQGAISRHSPTEMITSPLTSANASTYGAVIMALTVINPNVFVVIFGGDINYANYPFNFVNVQIAQFTMAGAAAARPRPLPSR
jgi:hypothetical protein